MSTKWQMYERLMQQASSSEKIQKIVFDSSWTMVKTDAGHIGVAMTQPGEAVDPAVFVGKTLREAAESVKSWNLREAAVGLAAINATLNRPELFPKQENPDAFLRYRDRYLGKKVAVVGHFAYLEQRLEGKCELYVLERRPSGEDLPDPACEYILPDMDAVIITGSAMANKTLPRLLELSQNAFTVISGPSTPMSTILFDYGVNSLCGFCVTDPELTEMKEHRMIFQYGEMVCMEK